MTLYNNELEQLNVRDDYRELIELAIIFLGGDSENKIKIKSPDTMHQARWMARAINCKVFIRGNSRLSLFDNEVKEQTKRKIIANLELFWFWKEISSIKGRMPVSLYG